MMTVSLTCSDDGVFIDSDFVIKYYLCVQCIKTTMMPESICFLNRSFKMSYRGKGRFLVTKNPARKSRKTVPFLYHFHHLFKAVKTLCSTTKLQRDSLH